MQRLDHLHDSYSGTGMRLRRAGWIVFALAAVIQCSAVYVYYFHSGAGVLSVPPVEPSLTMYWFLKLALSPANLVSWPYLGSDWAQVILVALINTLTWFIVGMIVLLCVSRLTSHHFTRGTHTAA